MPSIPSFAERISHELFAAYSAVCPHQPIDTLVRPSEHADFQSNAVMALAKKNGKKPRDLAQEVLHALDEGSPWIASCEIAGPGFLNITVNDSVIMNQIQDRFLDERLGIAPAQTPETIVIDYAQPNVAKEMHVGHLRSSVLGDCLNNIFTFAGHQVIPRHHIGDWGTSFGMLIEYLINNDLDITEDSGIFAGMKPIEKLNVLYKQSRQLFTDDTDFQDRARHRVVAMQRGEENTIKYWQQIVDVSVQYFHEVYQTLDIPIDDENVKGESYYNNTLQETVDILLDKGVAQYSDGAVCVFFDNIKGKDGSLTPLIVQKSDGGFGYATTDLAAIRDRFDILQAHKVFYVVDARQNLHFTMVFDTARRAGFVPENGKLQQIPFGMVLGKDGKPFKTREGESALLMDLLSTAITRAEEIIAEKNQVAELTDELRVLAKQLGVGAIKYSDLSTSLGKDYVFDVNAMVSMQGNTSVYIQYAHARISSILQSHQTINPQAHSDVPLQPVERKLAYAIDNCADTFEAVSHSYEPHRLTQYLYNLSATFTSFYDQCSIKHAPDDRVRENRLMLVSATQKVLAWGLQLLGIAAPEHI